MPRRREIDKGSDDEEFDELPEDEAEYEDSEEEDGGQAKKSKKRSKRSEFIDDAAEEDDDEEDEEDVAPKKKKKSMFIDDIAAVDEDEEEEEIEDDAEDLIDDRDVELPDEAAMQMPYHRRAMEREREEQTEEELERYIEQRYKTVERYDYDEEGVEAAGTVQSALLPTLNDPKLWMLVCRPGHEREVCVQLLQKYYTAYESGSPLMIKSVVCLDHLKGYIYIEAEKEAHVKDAIRGLRTVFISKGVRAVPLTEMVDAITVNKKAKSALMRDSWVRMRNGLYKDDLAKVADVDASSGRATIHVIPRLDFVAMANRDEATRQKFPFGRIPTVRPQPRPFNKAEARNVSLVVTKLGDGYFQVNSHRFFNGYLEKVVAIKSLVVQETLPPIDDIQSFNAAGKTKDEDDGIAQGDDLAQLMAALPADSASSAPRAKFAKGDRVVIVRGDLQNMMGKVEDISAEGKVLVRPQLQNFNEIIDFDSDDLRKFFKVGDHVRVLCGQHSGQHGMVLQVQDDICIIMSDTTRQEMKVFARDLTDADASLPEVQSIGDYQLHDLVQLDATLAGMIVGIEKDVAKVMTTQGTPDKPAIRVCRVTDMQRKLNNARMATTESTNSSVRRNDFVTINEGPLRGKFGTVEHVVRGYLFIKSHDVLENSGFMCIRARSCTVRGGKQRTDSGYSNGAATPSYPTRSPAVGLGNNNYSSPYLPMSPGRGQDNGPRAAGGGPPGSFSGRSNFGGRPSDSMVGKEVKVIKGAYTGYVGRVKHETGSHVQLELDAISKVVTVPASSVQPKGQAGSRGPAAGGAYRPMGGAPRSQDNGRGQPAPFYASRTPLHPSMTPMHPSFGPGTPAHPGIAPNTPAHPNTIDDNYDILDSGPHPISAPTPTWTVAPHHQNAYVPAPTPAYTPSEHAAPTPADVAPTPGTPGFANTPGLASTPYMQAPTPGHGMGDTAPTPGTHFDSYTPAATHNVAPTPGLPTDYTPALTPGTAYTPATPGFDAMSPPTAGEMHDDYSLWQDVLVELPSKQMAVVSGIAANGHMSLQYVTQSGNGSNAVSASGTSGSAAPTELTLVPPLKKDRVKILRDDQGGQGLVGVLIGMDGTDCIVKSDSGDMKVVDVRNLGKLVAV